MLIHSFLCLAAGAFAPSGAVAVASAASAPTVVVAGNDADLAPMSFESVLARLEQVEALRAIARRTGREDRLADLDALEARLFAMAEQIASAPVHAAAPAAPVTNSAGSLIFSRNSGDPNIPHRRVFEGEPAGPMGDAKPAHLLLMTVDRSRDMTSDPDRRRAPAPFVLLGDEKNPVAMTGTGRRPVPEQRRAGPGMGDAETGLSRVAEGDAGLRRSVGQPVAAPSVPGTRVTAAAARGTESIDHALRDLRSDLITAPR